MSARTVEALARSLRAMPPSARRLVEEAIELLLLACDEMDGDPDEEDGGDAEPSLGSVNDPGADQTHWGFGGSADLEQDAGDEPEQEDAA